MDNNEIMFNGRSLGFFNEKELNKFSLLADDTLDKILSDKLLKT